MRPAPDQMYGSFGRCENVKLWKMYFLQMNFGCTHKNKIVLEEEKGQVKKNAPIFAKIHLKRYFVLFLLIFFFYQ